MTLTLTIFNLTVQEHDHLIGATLTLLQQRHCALTSSIATRTKRPLDVDDDAAALDDDDFGLGHS